MQYSKEKIRNDILEHAKSVWKLKDIEKIDPLIIFFAEALANELFKLWNEFVNYKEDVWRNIAIDYLPSSYFMPRSASCLMHVASIINKCKVDTNYVFYREKVLSNKASLAIRFKPSLGSEIINGEIKYYLVSGSLYKIYKNIKEQVAVSQCAPCDNSILFAVELSDSLNTLEGLKLYVSGFAIKDLFKYLRCYSYNNLLDINLHSDKGYYFISIGNTLNANALENEKIIKYIESEYNYSLEKKKYIWIKMEFPKFIPSSNLKEVEIWMNVFVVCNNYCKTLSVDVYKYMPIIELDIGEYESFNKIISVDDNKGNKYYQMDIGDIKENTYKIIRGNFSTFDINDINNHVEHLYNNIFNSAIVINNRQSDLLYFHISNIKKEIGEMIKKIKINKKSVNNKVYLVFSKLETKSCMFVTYSLCNANYANGIKKGESFSVVNNSSLKLDSIFSLSTSSGGTSYDQNINYAKALKFDIFGGRRIYSKNDIINYINFRYRDIIQDISVELAYENKYFNGIKRVININIVPKYQQIIEEGEYYCNSLLEELNKLSPMFYSYSIKFIKGE